MTGDNNVVGWVSKLSQSITAATRHLFAPLFAHSMDTHQQQQQIAAQPATPMLNPTSNLHNCCIMIRMEGKCGVKRVRIPYSTVLDSYEDVIDAILKRYLSENTKSFNSNDFVVKLREIGDTDWPIDIENTEDLALAFNNTLLVKTEGHIKMSAVIRLESDPPIVMLHPDERSVSNPHTAVTDGVHLVMPQRDVVSKEKIDPRGESSATSGDKRKVVIVTPTKKSSTKKHKVTKSVIAGGSKLSVRTRIIRSIAELRALGKPNPPRIEVAVFAGYTSDKSKGFTNPLSALKTEGMIMYPDAKSVSLTDKGLESDEAKGISPPRDNAEVHLRLKALLKPTQQNIFEKIVDGRVYLRDELAAAVGYSNTASKGFANSIGRMSTLGLVNYPKDDTDPKRKLVQLTDMCFPFSKLRAKSEYTAFRALTPPLTFPPTQVCSEAAGEVPMCQFE